MTSYDVTSRHLAASEVLTDLLQSQGIGLRTHVVMTRSQTPLTHALLHNALLALMARQPLLRMRILSDPGRKKRMTKYFEEMAAPRVPLTVETGAPPWRWLTYAQEHLHKPFDSSTGPLWSLAYIEAAAGTAAPPGWSGSRASQMSRESELTLLSDSALTFRGALVFRAHPAISDSVSMSDFLLQQLLPEVIRGLEGRDSPAAPPPLSLPPAADGSFSAVKASLTWAKKRDIKKAIAKGGVVGRPKVKSWLGARNLLGQSHVLPLALSRSVSQRLMEEVHAHGVSLQHALVVAASLALGLLANVDCHEDVVVGFPVDLRQFHSFSVGRQPLGLWEGRADVRVPRYSDLPAPEAFWAHAQDARRKCDASKPWASLAVCKETLKQLPTGRPASFSPYALRKPHFLAEALPPFLSSRDAAVRAERYYALRSPGDDVTLGASAALADGKVFLSVVGSARWLSAAFCAHYTRLVAAVLQAVSSPPTSLLQHTLKLPPALRAQALAATPLPIPAPDPLDLHLFEHGKAAQEDVVKSSGPLGGPSVHLDTTNSAAGKGGRCVSMYENVMLGVDVKEEHDVLGKASILRGGVRGVRDNEYFMKRQAQRLTFADF